MFVMLIFHTNRLGMEMKKNWFLATCCMTSLLLGCGENNETKTSSVENLETTEEINYGPEFDLLATPVGDVSFHSSCNTEAAPLVERGVALMHNMMYPEAQLVFSMADDIDADCAMSYWGQAMVMVHPLWGDALSADDYQRGIDLSRRAQSIEGTTEREKDYFRAIEAFYIASLETNMAEGFAKIAAVWEEISDKYPEDMDAKAFESLFKIALSSNDPEREEAGQLAMDILKIMPDHPGGHHYVIHAYDTAKLAIKALDVADHYGEITPKVPHASHMMTHTYTRLGKWDSAIEWNNISAGTALELCIQNGEVNSHYPHAMDYLAFAHLQKGDDSAALEIEKEMAALDVKEYESAGQRAIAYAFGSIPARYALERKDWERAITLKPMDPPYFPWIDADKRDIINTHFARALGYSMLGRPDEAEADIAMMEEMIETLPMINGYDYYLQKMKNQLLVVQGWQQYAKGDNATAISLLKQAAMNEASSENAPSNPGDILPAEELLGDLYLLLSQPQEAHDAYKLSLERSPGRYNSIYGAGMTAFELGDMDSARKYFTLLIENAEGGNSKRESLNDAKMKLASLN